jgi:hypothetical protein
VDTPREDHALTLEINRAVPRWLNEQVRQDVCQDVAVAVLSGQTLTAELVRDVLKRGRRVYGLRWEELSLDAWCYQSRDGQRWSDVLSHENPIHRFRPKSEPTFTKRREVAVPERIRKGYTVGSSAHASKLTEAEVLAIRHMYHSGRYSQGKLAKEFGVAQTTVFNILVGSTWKHIGGPVYMPDIDKPFVALLESAGVRTQGSRAWNKDMPSRSHYVKDDTHMGQTDGFDEFWALYPKRIAKFAALKAYEKARSVATSAEILAGLKGYLANLPEEMRYVAHAASWLNAGRWMDEYDLPVARLAKKAVDEGWYEDCQRQHKGECGGDRMRHHLRSQMEKAS